MVESAAAENSLSELLFLALLAVALSALAVERLGTMLSVALVVLGIPLGLMLEENLRKALTLSRRDPSVFFTRPISLAMLGIAVMMRIPSRKQANNVG